jgi:hypothetical protein
MQRKQETAAMLSRVAFGLALVLATVSGSLAATHAKKSNAGSQNCAPAAASVWVPSQPTIFGWPVYTNDRANRK